MKSLRRKKKDRPARDRSPLGVERRDKRLELLHASHRCCSYQSLSWRLPNSRLRDDDGIVDRFPAVVKRFVLQPHRHQNAHDVLLGSPFVQALEQACGLAIPQRNLRTFCIERS